VLKKIIGGIYGIICGNFNQNPRRKRTVSKTIGRKTWCFLLINQTMGKQHLKTYFKYILQISQIFRINGKILFGGLKQNPLCNECCGEDFCYL